MIFHNLWTVSFFTIQILILMLMPCSALAQSDYAPFPELSGAYMGQPEPGTKVMPFARGIIDPAEGLHSSIAFSTDGTRALWTGMGKNSYISKLKDGVWTKPEPILIDATYGIGEPVFSLDGSRLYFLCRRPPANDPVERERIWYVTIDGDKYSAPALIDSVVAAHPTHWQFSFAQNNNLYFTSEKDGVEGAQDIFESIWDGKRYLEPVNLGPAINSDNRDLCPFVAPDESYLIFARKVPDRYNRTDLFISFRDSSGNWSEAVNMGPEINTEHNDICPMVSPDGRFLFFLRVSGAENGLFWVSTDIIDSYR